MRDLFPSSRDLYDVIIIGGGIAGTGIARDAAMRGMSVALFESNDLSSGTTSRSSRLIHGGLRYLDTYDFGLVLKDLREREKLLHLAPHLVRPLKFVVPNYGRSYYDRFRLRLGMLAYDLFSMGKMLPSHRMLSPEQVAELEPCLKREGLQGGALFYDCQASFVERIAIENALSAAERGAKIFNHARVIGYQNAGVSDNVSEVEDLLSGKRFKFRSRILVNAAGPWTDDVLRALNLQKTDGERRLRTTQGIHVVIPRVNESAIIVHAKSDNRLFFVIPWLGYSLIGTTDTDFSGNPAESRADDEDIRYLVMESSSVLQGISRDKILFTYSGVRPLVRSGRPKRESDVSRNYRIVEGGPANGVVSVLGVKITSYRIASKDATDLISRRLGRDTNCSTDKEALPGGRGIDRFDEFARVNSEKLEGYGLDKVQGLHLLEIYGSRVSELIAIMDIDKKYARRVCPNNADIVAQIILAVKAEFALTVSDFLLRRAPIAFSQCRGLDCVENVAAVMGGLLDWDEERMAAEIQDYKKALDVQLPVTTSPNF